MEIDLSEGRPKNEFIHRLGDYKSQLKDLRQNGLKKGSPTGFEELYEHYSVKKGSTTYLIASPAVGKSSILYEILINLAQFEGWKIAIFSPEGGSPTDLFAEMLWAYLRKPFLKNDVVNATEKETEEAYAFMEKHFYIIDSGLKDLNAESYYRAIKDIELEDGVKIDGCVIDPIVELNINPDNKREDLALGSFLTKVRKFSSENNIHTWIAVHTRQMQLTAKKQENGDTLYYYPQPTFFDAAGGQMYGRKGYMILSLWRPPQGLLNPETEAPYDKNETVIEILKVKPKVMGKVGKISLFYDAWSSRFYEKPDGVTKQFSQALGATKDEKGEDQTNITFN
jgi:hypothetical protein